MQAEQNRLKESYIDKKLTIEEYEQAIYTTEMKFMLSKRDLLKQYKQDTSEIQGAIYDKIINMADKTASMQQKKEKESHDIYSHHQQHSFYHYCLLAQWKD